MQTLMVKCGSRYRKASAAEIAEVAGDLARRALNRLRPRFDEPQASREYLRTIYAGRDYETLSVLFLDAHHRLIECVELFRGSVTSATIHPREVAKEGLWRGCVSVILAHNHPSGEAFSSAEDQSITSKIRNALQLVEIRLMDHLIIGSGGACYSMAEHGEL